MKENKKSRISELHIDVLEYMFTEWLVRQGLFSAYKENYEKFLSNHRSLRDNFRTKLRSLSRSPILDIEDIIATSFPFIMTVEGYDFWLDKSNLWRRFCSKFRSIL